MEACPLGLLIVSLDRFHLDGHSSESTAYSGSYFDDYEGKIAPRLSLREPSERWRLAY